MKEDINQKVIDDELNKENNNDIGLEPDRYVRVPRMARCIECKRLFDLNTEKAVATSNGYICSSCIK